MGAQELWQQYRWVVPCANVPCLALPCMVIQKEDAFCGPPFRGLLPAADAFFPDLATRRSRGVERGGDVMSVLVRVSHHTVSTS
jgi:hypothetical protein